MALFNYMCLILVLPEIEIIFPNPMNRSDQETGVCFVKTWPPLTEMDVWTDDNCKITKDPIKSTDMYTTAIFFTLDNISSFCLQLNCWTQFKTKITNININKY